MVRQRTLTPSFQGSNPCSPAKWGTSDEVLFLYYGSPGSRVVTGFLGLLNFSEVLFCDSDRRFSLISLLVFTAFSAVLKCDRSILGQL